jgi:hypothetical protein
VITHIVVLTFAAEDPEQRVADAAEYQRRLVALRGQVPGLLSLDVGTDLGVIDGHYELGLVTTHPTYADLEAYQVHPLHAAVREFGKSVVQTRAIVDFES